MQGSEPAAALAVPPRGTRPRNRRAQIRSSATELFYEHGYAQVSVADVADSVNIGPSALYRHFTGKADLLFEALQETTRSFAGEVDLLSVRDLPAMAQVCARIALANRAFGVLWQRESRNLEPERQPALRRQMRDAIKVLAGTIGAIRPELAPQQAEFVATAVVSTTSSISFHRLTLDEPEFQALLAELAERVLRFTPTRISAPRREPDPTPAALSRRDELTHAATRLFARVGFDAVSIDDIGAAVGIAGPSVYNHFGSKHELLEEAISRGRDVLQRSVRSALAEESDPAPALRRMATAYVTLALQQSDLISMLITETRHLPDPARAAAHTDQLTYINDWVQLVQRLRPDEDVTVSRMKVLASQMLANSIARTGYVQGRPGLQADLIELCWILLR